jgi:polysaccharide biosynthesis/export protein
MHNSALRNLFPVELRYNSVVTGGGMVKAIWAVACSALVVLNIAAPLAGPVFAQSAAGPASPAGNAPGPMDNSALIRRHAPPPTGSQADQSYLLGPEDQLRISVWDNKELSLDLVVRPDGKISMPLLQDVVAEGLTAGQLAANIQEGLSAFIVNPVVSVIVLQVNAPKYYVIGYVGRAGTYPLRGDVSVLQALALAGGLGPFASPRSIKLIRATKGKQEVRKINYYKVLDSGKGNYLLKPGDTIVVP